ncbi:hypothetical protein, partial [Paraburkholderia sp. BR14320]
VFKDRSAQPAAPEPPLPGTASFASLLLQQRNEIMESGRQHVKPLLRISFGSKDSHLNLIAHIHKRLNSRQIKKEAKLVSHPIQSVEVRKPTTAPQVKVLPLLAVNQIIPPLKLAADYGPSRRRTRRGNPARRCIAGARA